MPENEDGRHTSTGVILSHVDLLTYEEIIRVTSLATQLGVRKVRLTGGEPLVRKGVLSFIKELSKINNIEDLALTTNGVLLGENAEKLYQYGVNRLNISLDSLNADNFFEITRRDHFKQVFSAIHKAKEIGFKIKINVVAMRDINSHEFKDFVNFAIDNKIQVRFIEFMPLGKRSTWSKNRFISSDDIITGLKDEYTLSPVSNVQEFGPAEIYQVTDSQKRTGEVGFISPLSHHFCDKCNRLRLTSEGKLRACLLNDEETDLKKLLRNDCSDDEILQTLREVVVNKPKGHLIDENGPGHGDACAGQMSRIGG